ncbi:hypothetical protein AKO1_006427 [Acrasis kona]|uniref:Uncharacterized protein n=1 Tax=Acrasis kona TaxID=1008807 RepID=A0AAW2YIW3_9EUKA
MSVKKKVQTPVNESAPAPVSHINVTFWIFVFALIESILLGLSSSGYFTNVYTYTLPLTAIAVGIWIAFAIDQIINKQVIADVVAKVIGASAVCFYVYVVHNKLVRECVKGGGVRQECILDPEWTWYLSWTFVLIIFINSSVSFLARFITSLVTEPKEGDKINFFYNKDPSRIITVSLLYPIVVILSILHSDEFFFTQYIPLSILCVPVVVTLIVSFVASATKSDVLITSVVGVCILTIWPITAHALGIYWLKWIPHIISFAAIIGMGVTQKKDLLQVLFGTTPMSDLLKRK